MEWGVVRGLTFSLSFCVCSAVDGNFEEIARQILKKASDIPSKKTFTAQNYMFHVQNDRGVTFLCVADADMGHRVPYAFLNDIKDRWVVMREKEEKTRVTQLFGN